jgi:predicted ester cyclase
MDNATIARRWFREVWAEGGERTVDELLAPDAVGWMEGRDVDGIEDYKAARRELLAAFPDLAVTVEDLIAQGDSVAARWSVRATHRGPGLGMTPTNRPVSFRGMTWLEFRNGRVVRGWDSWNQGGLLMSLSSPA